MQDRSTGEMVPLDPDLIGDIAELDAAAKKRAFKVAGEKAGIAPKNQGTVLRLGQKVNLEGIRCTVQTLRRNRIVLKPLKDLLVILMCITMPGCLHTLALVNVTTYRNGVMTQQLINLKTNEAEATTGSTTINANDATVAADKKQSAATAVTGQGSAKVEQPKIPEDKEKPTPPNP